MTLVLPLNLTTPRDSFRLELQRAGLFSPYTLYDRFKGGFEPRTLRSRVEWSNHSGVPPLRKLCISHSSEQSLVGIWVENGEGIQKRNILTIEAMRLILIEVVRPKEKKIFLNWFAPRQWFQLQMARFTKLNSNRFTLADYWVCYFEHLSAGLRGIATTMSSHECREFSIEHWSTDTRF